jgi:hypothetical protein
MSNYIPRVIEGSDPSEPELLPVKNKYEIAGFVHQRFRHFLPDADEMTVH